MKHTKRRFLSMLLALVMVIGLVPASVFAAEPESTTIEAVRAAIQALSVDPSSYKAEDKTRIEAIQADFNSLSAEDQAILDAETSHADTGQPLGRVLETALWAVWSYNKIDNSTTLEDGVYSASSDPALESSYSKGKSTSKRQKTWSVKDVTVEDGKAVATKGSLVTDDDSIRMEFVEGSLLDRNIKPLELCNPGDTKNPNANDNINNCE